MKKLISLIFLSITILGFSACSQNNIFKSNTDTSDKAQTYKQSVDTLVDRLLQNTIITKSDKISLTSVVNLNDKSKETYFGKRLGQSIYDSLKSKGYSIVDVRNTKTVKIDEKRAMFVTKNSSFINKKEIENSYILVTTYSKYVEGILVNARILDYQNGKVLARARTVISEKNSTKDLCSKDENCEKTIQMKQVVKELMEENKKLIDSKKTVPSNSKRVIALKDANCTQNCSSSETSMLSKKVKNDTKSDIIPKKEKKICDYR